MKTLLVLGNFYLYKLIKGYDTYNHDIKYPLELELDEKIGAIKLSSFVDNRLLYGDYWYSSGTNELMVEAIQDLVNSVISFIPCSNHESLWLDIASNDGTLLSMVPSDYLKIGIDPIKGDQYNKAIRVSEIVNEFFSLESFRNSKYGNRNANVVTCIAMFYDVPNPIQFLTDVYEILDDNGVFVIQLSYTPLMITQLAFDNICHEHLYYYDLHSIKKIAHNTGFTIVDSTLNDTNGGSIRVLLKKNNEHTWGHLTYFQRLISQARIDSLLLYENYSINIRLEKTWLQFNENLIKVKNSVNEYLDMILLEDKKIMAYGASTKGNTLLQYFGLDNRKIIAIAERDSRKVGLTTVGTNIPIISEAEMRTLNPDYLFILPWHFIESFIAREEKFLISGGKFIVPLPKPYIFSQSGIEVL